MAGSAANRHQVRVTGTVTGIDGRLLVRATATVGWAVAA